MERIEPSRSQNTGGILPDEPVGPLPRAAFMALLLIHALLQKGFFRTAKSSGTLLERTVINQPQPA